MEQQLSDVRTRVIEVTEEMHDMKQMKEGESAMLAERITELEMQLDDVLRGQDGEQAQLLAQAVTSQDKTSKLAAEVSWHAFPFHLVVGGLWTLPSHLSTNWLAVAYVPWHTSEHSCQGMQLHEYISLLGSWRR